MNFLTSDWWVLIGLLSSILSIVSFVFYLRERHLRKLDKNYIFGFLHGIKILSECHRQETSGDMI